jgi:hypothetical protein
MRRLFVVFNVPLLSMINGDQDTNKFAGVKESTNRASNCIESNASYPFREILDLRQMIQDTVEMAQLLVGSMETKTNVIRTLVA